MEEKELRKLLLERLHIELGLFKDTLLRSGKEEIYKASYQIEVYINAYEILLEEAEELDADTIRKLLYRKCGILESLYREWYEQEDGFTGQLWSYVSEELKVMAQRVELSGRKGEEKDGTTSNQTAESGGD